MRLAPHGRHAIPWGTDGRSIGDAKGGSDRGAIVANKSAATRLRKHSRALAGGVVAL
jgi:hypothetical protein